jgi:hypothetical protein
MTDTMTEALRKCRDKFAEYVEMHKAKLHDDTPTVEWLSVRQKVNRNQEMVALCDAALASTPTVADDGKLIEDIARAMLATRLEQPSGMREARPFGGAGDAIDFACDHTKEPVFFLEDWRKDGAREWPEYLQWLKVQRDGAAEARSTDTPQ